MSTRRLIPLGLGVIALLAIVALAAQGGTLHSSGKGPGPSAPFWDYSFTTAVIVTGLVLAFVVYEVTRTKWTKGKTNAQGMMIRSLVLFILFAFAFGLVYKRWHHLHFGSHSSGGGAGAQRQGSHGANPAMTREFAFQWPEFLVVLAVLLVTAAVFYFRRSRRLLTQLRLPSASRRLADALDESLDDLRADPDLRRAIIAAYARMERALAAAGTARKPAEAPLEYLERALVSVHASADAVRRLTDLFEWARFSHHEPEPSMRDEAIDALVALRDELRVTEPVGA